MYCISSFALGGQLVADIFGLTLTNINGEELKAPLTTAINQNVINSISIFFTNSTHFTITDVAGAFVAAAEVLTQLLLILTGTYIFFIIWFLMGGDVIATFVVSAITIPYILLLGNMILVKIRGV